MDLLTQNEFSTVSTKVEGDGLIVRKSQPTDPILKEVGELRQMYTGSHTEGYHVAKVPIVLHYKWENEWKQNHADKWTWPTYLGMKLNSSEYRDFRIWEGNV